MTKETYRLLLDQLEEFPEKIRIVTFGGSGQPLMHKDLPEMIAELNSRKITDRIRIVSNGLLLSEKTSSALVDAGLSSIKISLQGIDSQGYIETSSTKIDFDNFLSNLDFFYKHKKQCSIEIKIVDISLYRGKNSDEEKAQAEEQFKKLFGDKCDKLGIERIVPIFSQVDYNKIEGVSGHTSRFDIAERNVKVCSLPFYRISILQNGCVSLCCSTGLHDDWMNIRDYTLKEIWDSESRKQKLINLLHQDFQDGSIGKCKTCGVKYDFAYPEDNLDPYAEEIAERLKSL